MIELQDITISHTVKNKQITIFDNINFKFEKGNLYAICGNIASSRTILLELLALIRDFDSGDIIINGKSIKELSSRQKRNLINSISYISSNSELILSLTVLENVMLLQSFYHGNTKEIFEKAIKYLNILDILELKDKYPNEISDIDKQKVIIARSLINDPKIILIDNLITTSYNSLFSVLPLFKYLATQKICIIIATENKEILKVSDVILKIKNKKIMILKKNSIKK